MRIVFLLLVLLPVALCHYTPYEDDYICRRLPLEIPGTHQDMMSRYVPLMRPLQVGDSIIVRGRLGPGKEPEKRFFLDLKLGNSQNYYKTPSSLHFSAQFDTNRLVQTDGYAVSKGGVFLGKSKATAYSSVKTVYLENIILDDDESCKDEPRCERLHGEGMTVIIGHSRVQHIR
ncbi:unnamed protein product [Caenorhabditis auriculariae]|uniref:Galectin n=1 Tax=Caenorhabditis auriculariae TaxID=2777116 RepID=A0A8S1H3H0_9PELO|nr:unnamed protein product [Caenorhabditis auriculariae]